MIPVFLTTCSKNKLGHGLEYRNWPNQVTVPDKLLKARDSLYCKLPRGDLRSLRGAVRGPDFFNDSTTDGYYLPAHMRYARGQFMASLEDELGKREFPEGERRQILDLWFEDNRLFFLSGLYGIVSASEPIQNYDVELRDLAADHWKEKRNLLTDFLLETLKSLKEDSILLDCCGDERYSDLVDWSKIEKENDFQVLHATDRQHEGAQVRAEAGRLAAAISDETLKKMRDGEKFPGVNADIKCVSSDDFQRLPKSTSGPLPLVGVIDTGLKEFATVTNAAKHRGWDKHFRFEEIPNVEALGRASQGGMRQCIQLKPERPHKHLEQWYSGKQHKRVFDGEILQVDRPVDLELKFSKRL